MRYRFAGEICGFGTTSGHRLVVGRWPQSPLGSFTDVMVQEPSGLRRLLAPSQAVADFVTATYHFDAVDIVAVEARREPDWLLLAAGPLEATVRVGGRSGLGRLLRVVPRRLAGAPAFASAVDPVARRVLSGVRTRGSAGGGRREWYGASDVHRLVAADARWDGHDLGTLTDVWPPVQFGFGSTPRRPVVVSLVTTIDVPEPLSS